MFFGLKKNWYLITSRKKIIEITTDTEDGLDASNNIIVNNNSIKQILLFTIPFIVK